MSPSPGLTQTEQNTLSQALAETPGLTLSFYSYGIVARRQAERGVTEYAVSPEDIATALSTTVTFDSGLLAGNTLCIHSEGARRTVVEHRPPQRTALWLEGSQDALRIPLPGLLLVRSTSGGRDPHYRVFAVAERPISYDAPLYNAPLPNVYTNGEICWGTVTRVTPERLAGNDLAADWAQLLATPFGSHSVSGKCRSHPEDVRKLYLDLEQRRARVYPRRQLVPLRATLGSMLGVGRER